MEKEYIKEINNLLQFADVELLDFIFQLLQKSVEKPTLSIEQLQPA